MNISHPSGCQHLSKSEKISSAAATISHSMTNFFFVRACRQLLKITFRSILERDNIHFQIYISEKEQVSFDRETTSQYPSYQTVQSTSPISKRYGTDYSSHSLLILKHSIGSSQQQFSCLKM